MTGDIQGAIIRACKSYRSSEMRHFTIGSFAAEISNEFGVKGSLTDQWCEDVLKKLDYVVKSNAPDVWIYCPVVRVVKSGE